MKRVSVILALLAVLSGARAEGPDDQYVLIYNLIQEADSLNNSHQPGRALAKYLEAQTTLQTFQKGYPNWNTQVVRFRLNYLAAKLAALTARVPAPAAPVPQSFTPPSAAAPSVAPAQPAQPLPPPNWENQLRALESQVQRLEADKVALQAKLKEALSAQPARSDPRELARAEERITELLKENDSLKVNLAQEKAKPAPSTDAKALKEARQALAQANRNLAEQTRKAKALEQEKTFLQIKLNNVPPSSASASALAATRKALENANRNLAEQTKHASQLAQEKEALQSRLKALQTESEAAAALRTENQLLKKQLAKLSPAPPTASAIADLRRRLALAQTQIAALESDKEILRLQKIGLEDRVKQLSAPTAAVSSPGKPKDAGRIRELQQQRNDLRKQLDAANKELTKRKGKVTAARLVELDKQVAALRARLEVYEARQVPYTAEELALFRKPEAKLARTDSPDGRTSVKELPPGTVELVAEAQRDFSARRFDRAEEKYLQVLRQDQNNVPTLANLAAIELELNHLAAAESNILQAVALAPDDAYGLSVLGHLRFRQAKYDQALEALSRAAKLEPQNAEIQNYLGLTLSEKGLRGPAETALRKAIQLEPGYGDAHNNLAVIYLTQQPPSVELARWHYQKALAAGNPRNPQLEQMLEAKKAAEDKQP
jgi:hypothetical protein